MKISVITCTYGRVSFLQESIACFLEQDYDDKELIVLNSFPGQRLLCDIPGVRIINLNERPKSLGECRNIAVAAATGEVIVQLDDDDIALPHLLSLFASKFKPGLSWIWLASMFHSEKAEIKKIVKGNISCVAYTKEAWHKVGGFSPLTVGEDKNFIGKLSSLTGEHVELTPNEIGFIYGWDNGSPHISGLGTDEQRGGSSHVWAEVELSKRVHAGTEPTGEMVLQPKFEHDWRGIVGAFLKEQFKIDAIRKNAVCVVELGRYGDIINILPVLKHINDTFGKPHLMVSREFASVLDGVSYVIPYVVDINNNDVRRAIDVAEREFEFVLCAQIWGRNFAQIRSTPAYNMDSWNNCGMLHRFNDKTMLPLFDQRDAKRESELVNYVTSGGKAKVILVQTSKSVSSPWGYGAELMKLVCDSFGDRFRIIDLSGLTVHRIYDLIGLMDAAECLVTCDSAPLHLAAASSVPVVALVNPMPWLGTEPRCVNLVRKFTYAEAEKNSVAVIHAIEEAVSSIWVTLPPFSLPVTAPTRRVFHAVAPFKRALERDQKRVDEAQESWKHANHRGVTPMFFGEVYRRSAVDIGDTRNLPYLKDVLGIVMGSCDDSDIIMFTNDDIWIHPELPDLIRFHVSVYGVCTSRRCEVNKLLPEGSTPEDYAKAHQGHIGRDLFAATKGWLVANWERIPDFILGASRWDLFLAYLVRYEFGFTLDKIQSLDANAWPAELPVGFIAHVRHENQWSKEFADSPAEKHNKRLYEENLPKVIGRKV